MKLFNFFNSDFGELFNESEYDKHKLCITARKRYTKDLRVLRALDVITQERFDNCMELVTILEPNECVKIIKILGGIDWDA